MKQLAAQLTDYVASRRVVTEADVKAAAAGHSARSSVVKGRSSASASPLGEERRGRGSGAPLMTDLLSRRNQDSVQAPALDDRRRGSSASSSVGDSASVLGGGGEEGLPHPSLLGGQPGFSRPAHQPSPSSRQEKFEAPLASFSPQNGAPFFARVPSRAAGTANASSYLMRSAQMQNYRFSPPTKSEATT